MKKVVAIGDSITWGFPYGEKASWVQFLSENLKDIVFINRGMNGDTFQGVLSRLSGDVISLSPDHCILTAGINDIFMGYSLQEIQRTAMTIIERLKNNQIEPILGIPINILDQEFGAPLSGLQKWLMNYASENRIARIDFRGLNASDFGDEIHPNAQGYLKMGRKALEILSRLS